MIWCFSFSSTCSLRLKLDFYVWSLKQLKNTGSWVVLALSVTPLIRFGRRLMSELWSFSSELHFAGFVCVRCSWSWTSWWSTGTRSCSGGRRLDGSSLRRRWMRRRSAGGGLTSPPCPSDPCWNSGKPSPTVRRLSALFSCFSLFQVKNDLLLEWKQFWINHWGKIRRRTVTGCNRPDGIKLLLTLKMTSQHLAQLSCQSVSRFCATHHKFFCLCLDDV